MDVLPTSPSPQQVGSISNRKGITIHNAAALQAVSCKTSGMNMIRLLTSHRPSPKAVKDYRIVANSLVDRRRSVTRGTKIGLVPSRHTTMTTVTQKFSYTEDAVNAAAAKCDRTQSGLNEVLATAFNTDASGTMVSASTSTSVQMDDVMNDDEDLDVFSDVVSDGGSAMDEDDDLPASFEDQDEPITMPGLDMAKGRVCLMKFLNAPVEEYVKTQDFITVRLCFSHCVIVYLLIDSLLGARRKTLMRQMLLLASERS